MRTKDLVALQARAELITALDRDATQAVRAIEILCRDWSCDDRAALVRWAQLTTSQRKRLVGYLRLVLGLQPERSVS